MTLQLGYSHLKAYSKLWSSSSSFPLQLSSDFLFVLLLRCIMWGYSSTSMNRMSVSSQECWQNVEVSRSVVSAEILPHPRLHRPVEPLHHHRFAFVVCAVHVNAVLSQIFPERLVVKFRTLVDPEPAGLPSAALDKVSNASVISFPVLVLSGMIQAYLLKMSMMVSRYLTVVILGESTHVHQISRPYQVYSFHVDSSPLEANSSWLV